MKLKIAPEIKVIEEADAEAELEQLYRVTIHNDAVTPMDFVVDILKNYFYLANNKAGDIMFTAHIYGSAYVQTLVKPEAQRRIDKAHTAAHNAGYPLKFTIEPE